MANAINEFINDFAHHEIQPYLSQDSGYFSGRSSILSTQDSTQDSGYFSGRSSILSTQDSTQDSGYFSGSSSILSTQDNIILNPPSSVEVLDQWTSSQEAPSQEFIEGLTIEDFYQIDRMEAEALSTAPEIGVFDSNNLPNNVVSLNSTHHNISRYVLLFNDIVRIQEFKSIGCFIYPFGDHITFTTMEFLHMMLEEESRRRLDPEVTQVYVFQSSNPRVKIDVWNVNDYMNYSSPHVITAYLKQRFLGQSSTVIDLDYSSWTILFNLRSAVCRKLLRSYLNILNFKDEFLKRCHLTRCICDSEYSSIMSLLFKSLYDALFPHGYVGGDNPLSIIEFTMHVLELPFSLFIENFTKTVKTQKISGVLAIDFISDEFLKSVNLYNLCWGVADAYSLIRYNCTDSEEECC